MLKGEDFLSGLEDCSERPTIFSGELVSIPFLTKIVEDDIFKL
jgi:hypothetical protein